MENIKQINISLNEDNFTYICKVGFLTHKSPEYGKTDIHFSRKDILDIVNGKIVIKDVANEIFNFALQDLGIDYIREIVKRSPLFFELSTQF